MSGDELLSDDDYVPVPLKEVARHELHPIGTAARIAELEEWQRRRTKITGQVIDETVQLDARIRDLEFQINEIQSVRNSEAKVSETRRLRIRELEAAIVKFWDYAKLVLPMPVHPAVGAIMRIGRDLESQSDRQ